MERVPYNTRYITSGGKSTGIVRVPTGLLASYARSLPRATGVDLALVNIITSSNVRHHVREALQTVRLGPPPSETFLPSLHLRYLGRLVPKQWQAPS